MPKAAPGQKTQEGQVSEAAILRKLQAREAAAKASAKKERPQGYDSASILARLGIGPKEAKTFNANVGNIKLSAAKGDANRPMFIFNYVIESDDSSANGVTVGNTFTIEDKVRTQDSDKGKKGEVWQSADEVIDDIMYEFQGIGEDTESYITSKDGVINSMVAAGKHHTKEKTPVKVTVSHWVTGAKSGMNVTVNPMLGDDLAESEAASDDLPTTDEQLEFTDADGAEAFDSEAWIDGWIDYSSADYGDVVLKVVSYDADTHQFNCVGEDDAPWNVADGYGVPADEAQWSTKNDA
jgi:hypothetical protein